MYTQVLESFTPLCRMTSPPCRRATRAGRTVARGRAAVKENPGQAPGGEGGENGGPALPGPAVGATNGIQYLGSNFSTTSGTFVNAGLSITLPQAGTYYVEAVITGEAQPTSAPNYVVVQLYNTTAGAAINKTTQVGAWVAASATGWGPQETIVIRTIITVAGATQIDLQVHNGAGNPPGGAVGLHADLGQTSLSYVQIA